MNTLLEGLTISITGILITFFALGLFILVMVLLQRIFPHEAEAVEDVGVEAADVVIEIEQDSEEEAIVAAIAVAVSYVRSRSQSQLGARLEEGRGSWWTISQRKQER